MATEQSKEPPAAPKKAIVDLTTGGTCEECDTELKCCVCGKEGTREDPLFYAQSGDHDHLLHRDGALVREAHGRFMCEEHYLADAKKLGYSKKDLGWPEPPKE